MSQTTRGEEVLFRNEASLRRSRSSHRRRPAPQRSSRRSSGSKVGGIHQRRDRKHPFYAPLGDAGTVAGSLNGTPVASAANLSAVTETTVAGSPSAAQPAWRTAVELWLRWNTAQEKVTAFMFSNGHQREKVEHLLDDVEQLRHQAVKVSEQLIGS